jgi:hypothetical protein
MLKRRKFYERAVSAILVLAMFAVVATAFALSSSPGLADGV